MRCPFAACAPPSRAPTRRGGRTCTPHRRRFLYSASRPGPFLCGSLTLPKANVQCLALWDGQSTLCQLTQSTGFISFCDTISIQTTGVGSTNRR